MIKSKVLILVLGLSSCSNFPLYNYGYNVIKESYLGLDSFALTEQYMQDSKYAFIRVRFGNSRSALLILIREKNNILEWISADGIRIFTFNGKVIKTLGLPNDIEILDFRDPYSAIDRATQFSYTTNFLEPILMQQSTEVSMSHQGNKKIESPIEGRKKIEVNVFEEKIYISSINWHHKNKYFINSDEQVEKTIQYLHPFSSPLTIEFVKKFTK